jgi:hypothetical protein
MLFTRGRSSTSMASRRCDSVTSPKKGCGSKELTVRGRTGTIAPGSHHAQRTASTVGYWPARFGRQSAIVLNHIAVIDVAQSAVRPDMAIVIRGARIAAIDRPNAPAIPRDAHVLDLAGKFAITGLVDMHNHLGSGANIPGPKLLLDGDEAGRPARQ